MRCIRDTVKPGDIAKEELSTGFNWGARMEGVTGFYWTIREFCAEGYLRFLFADADDDRSQIGYVVGLVATQLQHAARILHA